MSKISFRLIGAFLGVFLLGGIAGFLIFWQGANHGMLWSTPDVRWVIEQDMARGKWDQAVSLALGRMRNEKKDYDQYHEVTIIFLARANGDAAHRDEWISKAMSYTDRAVSLGPSDIMNFLQASQAYERAGDLVKDGCSYYQKALAASEKGFSLVPKDVIAAGGRQFPAQPVRTEFDSIIYRLRSKVNTCGAGRVTAPNP